MINRFRDIPQFISSFGCYHVDIPVSGLDKTINNYKKDYGLELNPDFQRGYVWTKKQQVKYKYATSYRTAIFSNAVK